MFKTHVQSRARRRGIVLVVILGMLGLLALIGVTFATFSNQSLINAKNFSGAHALPGSEELMDFALKQLVEDTSDPRSVVRGHSMLRDMYGNDAFANGALFNGFPDGSGPIFFTGATILTAPVGTAPVGSIQAVTNIPVGHPAFYDYPGGWFNRWIVKFVLVPGNAVVNLGGNNTLAVSQSFEVLADDASGSAFPNRVFYLAPLGETSVPTQVTGYTSPDGPVVQSALLANVVQAANGLPAPTVPTGSSYPILLDGRFRRAFNGPGVGALGIDSEGHPLTEYANFRYNGAAFLATQNGLWNAVTPGYGDPNLIPSMDEDYDACDLENWFLAIQSADGQVVVPSFHRPGILSPQDWTPQVYLAAPFNSSLAFARAYGKILRPRAADGHSPISFPDLRPDPSTGKITYDVDNDGDGVTDSVWLDLGYPARAGNNGQLFKPLFAFTVIGLNGKLPLNTGGNLDNAVGRAGAPNFTHASHLGNSPSEVDLSYALQNAYDASATNATLYDPFTLTMGANVAMTKAGNNPYTQVDNAGVKVGDTQLRNLLAGNRVPTPGYDPDSGTLPGTMTNGDANFTIVNGRLLPLPNGLYDGGDFAPTSTVLRATEAVPGRWGEAGGIPRVLPPSASPPASAPLPGPYNNSVRAGLSYINGSDNLWVGPVLPQYDMRDDNYNSVDLYLGEGVLPAANNALIPDYLDGAGLPAFAVERLRRFVTPIDLTGDGRVITYAGSRVELGPDEFGRVGYFQYFRPPGLPHNSRVNGPAQPSIVPNGLAISPATIPLPTIPDRSTNPYHAFEYHRNPKPLSGLNRFQLSGMPTNIDPVTSLPKALIAAQGDNPSALPTFATGIASDPGYSSNAILPADSQGMNEADEQNLYDRTLTVDEPFSVTDLVWLYRLQDVDGASLHSRLATLAPISFLNPRDGMKRRRLFTLEAWEPTNFVWASDNPVAVTNVPGASPGTYVYSTHMPFANNRSFLPGVDANMANYNLAASFSTPSVAHRDRRINLNFPLPVSNSPIEPIRQKWIRETYTLLKQILPPKSVDTPEELAQLSQYVVNIVDFRDPDCTMTKFVNTDVVMGYGTPGSGSFTLTAPNNYTQPVLAFTASAVSGGATLQAYTAYDPAIGTPTGTTPPGSPDNNHFLIQYGMENQPVAINEVLAIRSYTKNVQVTSQSNPNATNWTTALLFELVNTLTKDNSPSPPETSDMNLAGWDAVVLPDDGYGRPDPYTGQIPNVVANLPNVHVYSLGNGDRITANIPPSLGNVNPVVPALLASDQNADGWNITTGQKITGAGSNTNYYYVFGNRIPDNATGGGPTFQPSGQFPKPTTSTADDLDMTTEIRGRENQYFWLYIRRPPNPFDDSYDINNPNGNRVVVDCFRFAYMSSNGTGWSDPNPPPGTDKIDVNPTEDAIFSLERMQPFRGGHAVPPLTGAPADSTLKITAYGYTEQTAVPVQASGSVPKLYGNYGTPGTGASTRTTQEIVHTLGKPNWFFNNSAPAANTKEQWDGLVFNDRDFTSVAELLTVPAVSPGLFTKQFAESEPPLPYSPSGYILTMDRPHQTTGSPLSAAGTPQPFDVTRWNQDGPWRRGSTTYGVKPEVFRADRGPHVFPYLSDNFFYSSATEFADSNGVTWPAQALPPPPNNRQPFLSSDPDAAVATRYVGGPSGAGWHKMLEFFEVPTTANGAIGKVADGSNYDWLRQDARPGLLNLNLIIDEEVFLGLMGEYFYTKLNQVQLLPVASPAVVTEVDPLNGGPLVADPTIVPPVPIGYYRMDDGGGLAGKGFLDQFVDPTTGVTTWGNNMKAVFADFLKLRHGGSGFLFGHGRGTTGQNGQPVPAMGYYTPMASDRPFRSLSYPDINYTVMRPAAPPPSSYTIGIPLDTSVTPNVRQGAVALPWTLGEPNATPPAPPQPNVISAAPPWVGFGNVWPAWGWPTAGALVWDPGLKNPYLFTKNDAVQSPALPPRRLFQVSDWWGAEGNTKNPPSNAASGYNTNSGTGDPRVNNMVAQPNLAQPNVDLTSPMLPYPEPYRGNYTTFTLGSAGDNTGNRTVGPVTIADQRDHPYFRSEWLQRVMNLTTVRTHQYAVWITVGFFEVSRQGDPQLATLPFAGRLDAQGYDRAYDLLGLELGVLDGKNVRYRSFFVIDRTQAVGYNPYLPNDYRACILYRQSIE